MKGTVVASWLTSGRRLFGDDIVDKALEKYGLKPDHIFSPLEDVDDKMAVGMIEFIGQKVIFLGDGVPVYKNIIEERLKLQHFYAPANISKQRAGSVAVLGKMYYNRSIIETAESHEPVYLRLSQAERERNENNLGNRE